MAGEDAENVRAALPRHVAFIMDGNGRWATARGLSRAEGHVAGAETVRRVTEFALRRGIRHLTLYAFSTENWSRPQPEVDALMRLLGQYVESELETLLTNDIRLRIIGDPAALSDELQQQFDRAVEKTRSFSSLTLTLGINYGGRDEIVRAARKTFAELMEAGRNADSLDETLLAANLDTAGIPDPDIIIRTAGEQRLSNFLIWQAAYAELIFSPRTWPDFFDEDFELALAEYAKRTRTFGALQRQAQ